MRTNHREDINESETEQEVPEQHDILRRTPSVPSVTDRAADDRPGESMDHDKPSEAVETEEARLNSAAERLRQIDWLKPEVWRHLDQYQRRVALDTAGREMGSVYHHPSPPLLTEDLEDGRLLGQYGDGYRLNPTTGEVEGADYGITLNRFGETDDGTLLGDDPVEALRTYAHEFRHSYQYEQAQRYDKPHFWRLVDDLDQARTWSDDLAHYIPPTPGNYSAYATQPVEQDAREFADKLVGRVFEGR